MNRPQLNGAFVPIPLIAYNSVKFTQHSHINIQQCALFTAQLHSHKLKISDDNLVAEKRVHVLS